MKKKEQSYNSLKSVIDKRDIQEIDQQLKSFLGNFGKVYLRYI